MAPLELPDPIPGWWLEEALAKEGWAQVDLAEELGHSTPDVVNRWIRGRSAKGGLTRVQWYACLAALDLPKDWRPPKGKREKA